MDVEYAPSFGEVVPNLSQIWTLVTSIVERLLVLVAFIIWVVFWGVVARMHLQRGDFGSAGIVGLLFILPAIIVTTYYMRDWLPFDFDRLSPELGSGRHRS